MTGMGTPVVAMDFVLLGSRVAFGPLELVPLGLVAVAWLLFGAWLRHAAAPARRGPLAGAYGVAAIGLFASVLAQDVVLFYAGLACASYATVVLLIGVHGPTHARTTALLVVLLVLGDLLLFELLVHLYAGARSTGFDDLRAAYRATGGGLSFAGVLLVATGGGRLAVLILLLPMPGGVRPWHPGAALGLLCIALVAGPLTVFRLVHPSPVAPGALHLLLAMLGAAVVLYLLAASCVLAKARIDRALGWVSRLASHPASVGAGRLVRLGQLLSRLAPRFLAMERRLLSWPVAVATSTVFAVLLALAFAGGGAGS